MTSEYKNAIPYWHPEKNGGKALTDYAPYSHAKVWWCCDSGHEWKAAVYAVVRGSGCPYCAGKLPIPGETDLATTHPALAKEWDEVRNTLAPSDVTQGSTQSVWWRCSEDHSWKAAVFSRAGGSTCPYCSGKKVLAGFNDLGTTHPELAEQWFLPLNGGLSPSDVTHGSHKKVWWKCEEGHIWQAAIYSRTRERSAGCPVCSGKVKQIRWPDSLAAR